MLYEDDKILEDCKSSPKCFQSRHDQHFSKPSGLSSVFSKSRHMGRTMVYKKDISL